MIEALAIRGGLNAEGGSLNLTFATRATESNLHSHLELTKAFLDGPDRFLRHLFSDE